MKMFQQKEKSSAFFSTLRLGFNEIFKYAKGDTNNTEMCWNPFWSEPKSATLLLTNLLWREQILSIMHDD